MNDHDEHESLPPWDASILAAERGREGPTPAQRDALFARVDHSIATIGTPSSADPDGPSNGSSGAAASSASSVPLTAAAALRNKILGTALTYLVGVASGALAHDRLTRGRDSEPRETTRTSVSVANDSAGPTRDSGVSSVHLQAISQIDSDATAPITQLATATDAGRLVAMTSDASAQRSPQRPLVRDSNDLFAETNMVEMARSALARGRAAAALDAIEQHRRQFASGQLAEDRESLAVEALVTLGRGEEARRRAEAFRRRWPDGVYRARVDAALALIR